MWSGFGYTLIEIWLVSAVPVEFNQYRRLISLGIYLNIGCFVGHFEVNWLQDPPWRTMQHNHNYSPGL